MIFIYFYTPLTLCSYKSRSPLQEVHDDNNGGGDGAEDSIKFIHGRLPEVTKCVCARAESLVEAVRGLEGRLNEYSSDNGLEVDEDVLAAAACSLQNDLRCVTIP